MHALYLAMLLIPDVVHHLCLLETLLVFLVKGAELAVGLVDAWWLNLALIFLGGGGRRWRARIQELEKLGRCPDRWATAVGLINFDFV